MIVMKTKRMTLHLITYGLGDHYEPRLFKPVKNRNFIKPEGGLWASPVEAQYGWREWCQSEDFNTGYLAHYFTFDYSGKVMVIDSFEDARQMTWYAPFDGLILQYPDFEAMAMDGVDAIYLTERGEQATRFTMPISLYGWDCECVLIMNPNGITPTS